MTRAAPHIVLPDWPGLMDLDYAMAYTQLAEGSFRYLAKAKGVAPVDAAGLGVTRWARADLDRLIDSLPRRGVPMAQDGANDASGPAPAADPEQAAQAALNAARKRIKR